MENIVLKMYQTINGTTNVLACINPKIEQLAKGYFISYQEEDKTHVSMKIEKDRCILVRKGIYSTNLHLNRDGISYVRIISVYGDMDCDIECQGIICEEDHWQISYKMDEDQLISIRWAILRN